MMKTVGYSLAHATPQALSLSFIRKKAMETNCRRQTNEASDKMNEISRIPVTLAFCCESLNSSSTSFTTLKGDLSLNL